MPLASGPKAVASALGSQSSVLRPNCHWRDRSDPSQPTASPLAAILALEQLQQHRAADEMPVDVPLATPSRKVKCRAESCMGCAPCSAVDREGVRRPVGRSADLKSAGSDPALAAVSGILRRAPIGAPNPVEYRLVTKRGNPVGTPPTLHRPSRQ